MQHWVEQYKKNIFVYLLLCALFFFILHRLVTQQQGYLEKLSSCFVYPVLWLYKSTLLELNNYLSRNRNIHDLHTSIQQLSQELLTARAENIAIKSTQIYQENIQKISSYIERYNAKRSFIAQVLVRHFADNNHYLLVSGGSMQNISIDMVAVYKNCLIGRVVEVYPWYCKVQLITDRNCNIACITTESKVNGIHSGCNQSLTELNYVSHLSPIIVGETLISNGEGLIFPYGFGIGKIVSYQTGSLYQIIQVKPLVDATTLSYCVLIGKGQTISN